MKPDGGDAAFRDRLPPWRRALRYDVARLAMRLVVGAYLRVRVGGPGELPTAPCVVCFNHLSWADPFVLYAIWPRRPRLYVYGPKEADLRTGRRNRLIGWLGTAVPFEPGKRNLLASARRGLQVLEAGHVLAIAGEGRLSEDEGVVLPIQEGVAFFGIRAGVPIVPVGLVGTRWLRFGGRVEVRVGRPIDPTGSTADQATLHELSERVRTDLEALVAPPRQAAAPGPFGRWLTDVFADRPWRTADPPEPPAG
ncbi:MAG: lysophospholipid acyltransferase family protein [Candidatus Limnocylindrales bacterium]